MQTLAVERTIWINAPRARVWRAIIEPAQLVRWYAPGCAWDIPALEAGATIRFHNTETDIQLATIEAVEPPQRLTLRWQADPGSPDAVLINTFVLEEARGGTQVTIRQTGYESLPPAERQMWLDADQSAYTTIAQNLKGYLEEEGSRS